MSTAALIHLQKSATLLEAELRRSQHSHPLLFKAARELDIALNRYLLRKETMEVYGVASESSPATRDLIRECHVMIECATHLLHG